MGGGGNEFQGYIVYNTACLNDSCYGVSLNVKMHVTLNFLLYSFEVNFELNKNNVFNAKALGRGGGRYTSVIQRVVCVSARTCVDRLIVCVCVKIHNQTITQPSFLEDTSYTSLYILHRCVYVCKHARPYVSMVSCNHKQHNKHRYRVVNPCF